MTEQLSRWAAWHLPKCIVQWAAIRYMSGTASGEWSTTVVSRDALQKQEPDDSQDYLRDAVADGDGIII